MVPLLLVLSVIGNFGAKIIVTTCAHAHGKTYPCDKCEFIALIIPALEDTLKVFMISYFQL